MFWVVCTHINENKINKSKEYQINRQMKSKQFLYFVPYHFSPLRSSFVSYRETALFSLYFARNLSLARAYSFSLSTPIPPLFSSRYRSFLSCPQSHLPIILQRVTIFHSMLAKYTLQDYKNCTFSTSWLGSALIKPIKWKINSSKYVSGEYNNSNSFTNQHWIFDFHLKRNFPSSEEKQKKI